MTQKTNQGMGFCFRLNNKNIVKDHQLLNDFIARVRPSNFWNSNELDVRMEELIETIA